MNSYKIFTWCILLISFLTLIGCNDEKELNLNLSEVKTLYAPEDNVSIALDPKLNPSVSFQWDQAYAEDGSLVLYEIAFDQADGNFSSPFYKTVSDGKGVKNELTLTHSQLNQIAKMGGADFLEKKKFKWTVLASKGSNVKMAVQTRIIELERPTGIDPLPVKVYITGSATETGTNLANGREMKSTGPSQFEIFTKLTAGTYKFTDGTEGDYRNFSVIEEGGVKSITLEGETTYSGDDKVYRIKLDFDARSVQIDEVKSVGFWYCVENKVMYDLEYTGGGIWKTSVASFQLSAAPWGGFEERHKYKVVLNDGTEDRFEFWGYKNNDSPGQDGTYGSSAPGYFEAFMGPNDSQWDWSWKLDRNAIQGKDVDFLMKFPGGSEPYASEYIIKN
jgi:starch-binding outer membrane protein SusE/F